MAFHMEYHRDKCLIAFIQRFCGLGSEASVSRVWLWNRYLNYVFENCGNHPEYYDQKEFDRIMQGVGVKIVDFEYVGICILKDPQIQYKAI